MINDKDLLNLNTYDDDDIQVLEGLKAVRARPGMYVGSSGSKGLHHLIWEILDNSIDEVLAGSANEIWVILKSNHVVSIADNGRGIPTGINKQTQISNLETVFTILHAGGKFNNNTYKVSGGLHGVGATCVNALSTFFEVTVCREGKKHYARFSNGGEVEVHAKLLSEDIGKKTGTTITWQPDFTIFDQNDYDYDEITNTLKRLAYLNKGTKLHYLNEVNDDKFTYEFPDGIVEWVRTLNLNQEPIHEIVYMNKTGEVKGKKGLELNSITIDFAFQYSHNDDSQINSFCNNINTIHGGTHLESFKEGILICIREKALEAKIIKNKTDFIKADVLSGLTAIVSLYYSNPEYEGQTKEVLGNIEIKSFIKENTVLIFNRFLEENPLEKEIILKHIENSYKLRLKIELTKLTDKELNTNNFLNFAGKLADCTIKSPDFSELYIVEGDSAGGSAKSARNREYQAILPIKGKLMNVIKNSKTKKILNNDEIKSLISAIGCSHTSTFDITKIQYGKLIIMTDADVDGSHIRTLLLTFVYQCMYPLIENGKVFIAQPPLYRAVSNNDVIYLFDEAELQAFKQKRIDNKSTKRYDINRFKGLGEMSPVQLSETTMDPDTRTLLKVTIEDCEAAKDTFNKLMGTKVEPRKKFILENYHNTKNLDI